jgi:hypothetical protein
MMYFLDNRPSYPSLTYSFLILPKQADTFNYSSNKKIMLTMINSNVPINFILFLPKVNTDYYLPTVFRIYFVLILHWIWTRPFENPGCSGEISISWLLYSPSTPSEESFSRDEIMIMVARLTPPLIQLIYLTPLIHRLD